MTVRVIDAGSPTVVVQQVSPALVSVASFSTGTVTVGAQTPATVGVYTARGEQGPEGPQGEQGLPGEQGPQGPQGEQGPRGIQGERGLQGEKGDTGLQGLKGDTGARGPKGDQGDAGPTGPAGPKGDTGSTGLTGPDGQRGPQGLQGVKGDRGPDGYSAYEVAQHQGFYGTQAEWLDSLQGTQEIEAHVASATPHPAYDDLPSLNLLFENGLV